MHLLSLTHLEVSWLWADPGWAWLDHSVLYHSIQGALLLAVGLGVAVLHMLLTSQASLGMLLSRWGLRLKSKVEIHQVS